MTGRVPVDGRTLTLETFLAVARGHEPVSLSSEARASVGSGREAVERAVKDRRSVYGVTTGFGGLSHHIIPPERARELQASLLRSHATGTGPPLPADVVRGLILLRLNSLAAGHSGVRAETLERLVEFLNRGLVPWIPEQGSVGASGDLAPLAHLGLALTGEGAFVARHTLTREPAAEVLAREGLVPLDPVEKEGVSLLNGTSLMASYLALGVADAKELLDAAVIASSLSFDALEGDPSALDDRLAAIRNSPHQRAIARAMRALLQGTTLATARTEWKGQDAYTLRCAPQVLGAVRLAIGFAEGVAAGELNAVTDNPVVFAPDEFVSGGNFHGQPLALALDTLGIGVQYVAAFSERRIARLLNPTLNRGFPRSLRPNQG